MADLPASVVQEDKRLERTTTKASEDLAKLRWRWTLDESNSGRVTFAAYARAVGRDPAPIRIYARGYQFMREGHMSLADAIEQARMGDDRRAATEAVAKARGVSPSTARQHRPTEVRRVLDVARERVEKNGGTIQEETQRAAEWIARSEQAAQDRTDDRRRRRGMRFVELEGHLDAARRRLDSALAVARAVEWNEEHQELLQATVANVRSLLDLIDVALAGAPDIDWDAELAALRSGDE